MEEVLDTAPWCSGLTCHPVTVESEGSNPFGVARLLDEDSPDYSGEFFRGFQHGQHLSRLGCARAAGR